VPARMCGGGGGDPQCPRDLRRVSTVARVPELRVRLPLGLRVCVCVCVCVCPDNVCCHIKASVSGRSSFQRSRTECGVS